jgi:hypothetical protein
MKNFLIILEIKKCKERKGIRKLENLRTQLEAKQCLHNTRVYFPSCKECTLRGTLQRIGSWICKFLYVVRVCMGSLVLIKVPSQQLRNFSEFLVINVEYIWRQKVDHGVMALPLMAISNFKPATLERYDISHEVPISLWYFLCNWRCNDNFTLILLFYFCILMLPMCWHQVPIKFPICCHHVPYLFATYAPQFSMCSSRCSQ